MSSGDSPPERQDATIESEGQRSAHGATRRSLRRSGRGIPALLDWIEEAQAVTWTPIAIVSIAVVTAALAVLLAVRLGWLPS
jgi:hypothetical protein